MTENTEDPAIMFWVMFGLHGVPLAARAELEQTPPPGASRNGEELRGGPGSRNLKEGGGQATED